MTEIELENKSIDLIRPTLAVIGGGYWGKNLIREFNNLGVLHTICEVDPILAEGYREQYPQVKVVDDWYLDVIENDEIKQVCVSLPAEMHYKFAKEALMANKDVYVEKPITLDMEEARELVNIARMKNKILMVGHLLHYHSCIIKIKELMETGELGRIKNIVSNRLNLGKFRTSENVLWSFAPHDISVIMSLCGDELPDEVFCTGKSVLTKNIPDITNTILKYNSQDIYVNINVNWLNPYKEQKLVIICEKGMILFDDVKQKNKLEIHRDYLSWSKTLPVTPEPHKNPPEYLEYNEDMSPLERECSHFIDCCKSRSIPITDGEEGYRVLQVLHMAQQSLEKEVKISNQKLGKNLAENIPSNKNSAHSEMILSDRGYIYHRTAIIDEGSEIGEGTKIWHNAHICSGAKIGKKCSLGQNVFVAGGAVLGDGCRVQNNVSVYSGVFCEENVFLGPSCVLTNDKNPRVEYSKNGKYLSTIIEKGSSIGANATIVCGTRIGKYALIGAGAVITKNVPDYAVVVGNPAKILRYTNEKCE